MNNITINLTISITKNDNTLEQIYKFISQLQSNNQSIIYTTDKTTLGETFDIYKEENNLKDAAITAYKVAIKYFFGKNWTSFLIKKINIDYFINTRPVHKNSKKEYMKRIMVILRWLHIKKNLSISEYENYYKTISKNIKITPRAALNCNDWICINDAKKTITNLFQKIKQDDEHLFYCLLLHFILATRIKETYNFLQKLKNAIHNNEYIYIETKTTKKNAQLHFRIPLTSYITELAKKINDIQSPSYFIFKIRNLLQSTSMNISSHGTRAIYRTSIDFLTQNLLISTEAKETYIDHAVGNKVFKSYQRQDYFIERIKIQSIYAYFIFECAGLPNLQKIVNDYVENFNQKYPEHSFSISNN